MKKILFLPLLLISCICFAQDAKEIIGEPIKIGNLLVAQKNFPTEMNWVDAKKACAALGDGWRLPTKSELKTLYIFKDRLGGFPDNDYWSSTEYFSNSISYQDFANVVQWDTGFKRELFAVRAVNNPDTSVVVYDVPWERKLVGPNKYARVYLTDNYYFDKTDRELKVKTAGVVDDDPWKSQLGPKNSYKTIDLNDNNFDKTNKGKKVEAASELPPNIVNALKRLTNKIDRDYFLKILDKPDPENKDGDICGTTTTGCYLCNKRVQISKFYKSRGKELFRTLLVSNFGLDLDLKSKINEIRKNGMYYCEANLTWSKYYCSRKCEYLHQKSKKGF